MNRETLDRIIKVEDRVSLMNETRLLDIEQTQSRLNTLATLKQLQTVDMKFNGVAYLSQLQEIESRCSPLLVECEKTLRDCCREQEQIRQIVCRFDEVIANKAAKSSVTDLRNEVATYYVTNAALNDFGSNKKMHYAILEANIRDI